MYSRAFDDEHLRAMRRRVVELHTTVIFPLLGAFVAVAPEAIPFAFGRRWEPMVVPAQILTVGGAAMVVMAGSGPLMYALGRARAMLYFQSGWLLAYASVVYVAAGFGIEAACVGASGVFVCAAIALYGLLLRPSVGISVRALWSDIGAPAAGTAVLIMTTFALKHAAPSTVPDVLAAALALPAGAAAYVLTLRLAFPQHWATLRLLTKRILRPAQREPRIAPSPAGSHVGPVEKA